MHALVFCIDASSGHACVGLFDFSFVVWWTPFFVIPIPWYVLCFLPVALCLHMDYGRYNSGTCVNTVFRTSTPADKFVPPAFFETVSRLARREKQGLVWEVYGLHDAAEAGDVSAVRLLLEAGMDPEARNAKASLSARRLTRFALHGRREKQGLVWNRQVWYQ